MMEKIRVLIVEDNVIIAQSTAALLKKHDMQVVAICDSGAGALDSLKSLRPDIALLDIHLAGSMDGISLGEKIEAQFSFPIIYLTDYADAETVARARKTHPANYLSKPFNELELVRAIEIAFENAAAGLNQKPATTPNAFIFIRDKNQVFVKVAHDEILFLEAERAYCEVVTEKKRHTVSTSMNKLHAQLNSREFMRVHRSYVVNVGKITAIEGNTLRFGDKSAQMTQEHRDELLKRLTVIK